MSRPTKFTDDARAEFLRAVRLGVPRKSAAALAGWSVSTYEDYVTQGRAAIAAGRRSDPKAVFVREIEEAEGQLRRSALAVVINAANGTKAVLDSAGNVATAGRAPDWKAAAWLMERRFPLEFGQRRVMEISGPEGGPIEVTPVSAEQLVAKVRALRAVPDPPELPSPNGTGQRAN